jgi:hypothetical protein
LNFSWVIDTYTELILNWKSIKMNGKIC